VHERVSHGTKAAAEIARELLSAERGGGFQNPVVRPTVVFVEELNVISSHGGGLATLSSGVISLGNLTLHRVFGENREVVILSQSGDCPE
jgi:hypothetical protein